MDILLFSIKTEGFFQGGGKTWLCSSCLRALQRLRCGLAHIRTLSQVQDPLEHHEQVVTMSWLTFASRLTMSKEMTSTSGAFSPFLPRLSRYSLLRVPQISMLI